MLPKLAPIAAAVVLTLGAPAQARDFDEIFSVRGYSTVGLAYSDEDKADFVNLFTQAEGVGASKQLSAALDSRMGLQIDMKLTDRLSALVQLVSEDLPNNSWDSDTNESFRPSLEWANVSYRVTDDFTVRAGRVVLPFLGVSEYRKVGYASHWLRPPVEVYGLLTFNSSDGVDASYRSTFGKAISTLRTHYGYQSLRSDVFDGELEIWGINDTVEIGSLMLRAAYINVHLSGLGDGLSPLLDPFVAATSGLPNGIGQEAAQAAERLRRTYDITLPQEAHLLNIGATYDPGQWFAMAEFFDQRSDTAVGKSRAGYVSAGYRWNSWTPYATLARTANYVRNDPGVPVAGLPAPLAAFGATINSVVLGLLNAERSQTTLSFGVRWDVAPKLALKSQFDYVDLGSNSAGLFQNIQPGFEAGGSVNLFSIAVDYVF